MKQLGEAIAELPDGACADLLILPLYASMPLELQVPPIGLIFARCMTSSPTCCWLKQRLTDDCYMFIKELSVQARVFAPPPEGCRRLIVATNIAETSITVDGVVYVVDSGMVKQKTYSPATGMESLNVVPISRYTQRHCSGCAHLAEEGPESLNCLPLSSNGVPCQ